jgi:peptide/nickel transport system substrate-binding protein
MGNVKLSRRTFLRTSAAAAAGALLASCAKATGTVQGTPTAAPQAATATPAPQQPTPTPAPAKAMESPVLAAQVQSGALPPLAERLPKDPRIQTPIDQIGEYSDTIQILAPGPGAGDFGTTLMPGMFGETNDGKLFANYAKGLEMSDDAKTYTFHIREGLKWSDGTPFTTSDVLFWYEDDYLNTDINPTPTAWGWTPAGNVAKLDVIDDYTFKMSWEQPNKPLTNTLMYWAGMYWNFATGTPRHYMEKYHLKYNPNVEDEAKAEGYDTWVQYYGARKNPTSGKYAAEMPALAPWIFVEQPATHTLYQASPYYWGTDPEGNQLPYFDKVLSLTVADAEAFNLKAVAGEADYASGRLKLSNLPLYMDNADKGNFVVLKFDSPRGTDDGFSFNRTSKDPVMRELYRDLRWNQAMSYAINRKEVQEVVFLGTGVVRQAAPNPECSYFKKEWEDYCVEYDPDKANALLDELGLDKRDADGYRLRPDGQTLALNIELTIPDSPTLDVTQVVAKHWEDVGVKVTYKEVERTLYQTRSAANEIEVSVWHADRTNEARAFVPGVGKLVPDSIEYYAFSGTNEWLRWHLSKGEQGEEPPDDWKQLFVDIDAWHTSFTQEDYLALATKIFDFVILDNLRVIGTVGFTTWPVIVKKDLGNFPQAGFMGDDTGGARSLNPETWYRMKA